jgi:diguanylate cyclase (GGDEF)-like protein
MFRKRHPASDATGPHRRGPLRLLARHNIWMLVALVLLGAGIASAALAAHLVAQSDSAKTRLAFGSAAAEITSTLRLALLHEEDLVVSGRAFVSRNPRVSGAGFDEWAESVSALRRYPELRDVGLLVPVSDARLSAFQATMLAHPVLPASRQPAGSQGAFQVIPGGRRPSYCFAVAGVVRDRVATLPPGLDYCAAEPALAASRDSGLSSYEPFQEGSATTLAVQTPIYRHHMPLATVAARRLAFVGWLAESLDPGKLLRDSLEGHPGDAVTFEFHSPLSNVTFSSGRVAPHSQSVATPLHNGWTVVSYGPRSSAALLASGRTITVLLLGTAMSIMIALLVLVLGTGRTRAISLVREKTRELSYLAHHDSLTGLPNRAQVMDRATQMLARTRRDPERVGAALFLDIDGFKAVNDTLGHAAGDELLKAVATQLLSVVREQDTVGRLGGDEFVVLIESSTGDEGADVVAERVLGALRRPVRLPGFDTSARITASVGIAVGQRATAEQLLHDADLALYAAKEGGKDRFKLYEAGSTEGAVGAAPSGADSRDSASRA